LNKLPQSMIQKGVTMDHTVPHRLHPKIIPNHTIPYNQKRIPDRL
jgi:hypothetical protein